MGTESAVEVAFKMMEEAVQRLVEEPSSISRHIEFPEECAGHIIGQGGAEIKRISKNSGARVNLSKDTPGVCVVVRAPNPLSLRFTISDPSNLLVLDRP